MRATRIVSGFASWRWMPFCALVAGSLLYVGLVVLIVPNKLGKLPKQGFSASPSGPGSDMLTSGALDRSAGALHRESSLPSPRRVMRPPPRGGGLTHALSAPPTPVAPLRSPTRREALGEPVASPPPPAPPPPPQPVVPEPENEPPAEPPTRIVQRSIANGLHLVRPRPSPAPAVDDNQPPDDDNDTGGASGDEPQ